jgi:hypothetical protein
LRTEVRRVVVQPLAERTLAHGRATLYADDLESG